MIHDQPYPLFFQIVADNPVSKLVSFSVADGEILVVELVVGTGNVGKDCFEERRVERKNGRLHLGGNGFIVLSDDYEGAERNDVQAGEREPSGILFDSVDGGFDALGIAVGQSVVSDEFGKSGGNLAGDDLQAFEPSDEPYKQFHERLALVEQKVGRDPV